MEDVLHLKSGVQDRPAEHATIGVERGCVHVRLSVTTENMQATLEGFAGDRALVCHWEGRAGNSHCVDSAPPEYRTMKMCCLY